MRSFLIFTALLPALSLAQRGGDNRGGNGFFGPGPFGGGNTPNTFITVPVPAPSSPAVTAPPPPVKSSATSPAPTGSSSGGSTSGVQASLIPAYGITAGVKATDGSANCIGDKGKAIPCTCPPSVDKLVTAVQAQVARGASFPSGNSAADQLARLNTCIVALQNVVGGPGSGVGCPVVATTWLELRTQLQSET